MTELLAPITAELIDHMGSDARVCNVARVSNDKWIGEESEPFFTDTEVLKVPAELTPKDKGLITYLARHQHESPFMHVVITMRINAPIFVARQWFKSTIGVVRNEVSRRYVDSAPVFWLPKEFHYRPDDSIKQGSGKVLEGTDAEFMRASSEAYAKFSQDGYNNLIAEGLAPEEARMFLPQNMMTSWIETGSLMYFVRVLGLRQPGTHAQVSGTQELAEKVQAVLSGMDDISHSFAALMKYNPRTILERFVQEETAQVKHD